MQHILVRADSLLSYRPDSAFSVLEEIRPHIHTQRRDLRMYYILLLTKAQDKCYIPHTSDSLMKIAVPYYEQWGNPQQRMEAYFYLGCIYQDLGDAPRAISLYQQAIDASKNKTEYNILSLIYSRMGTLFFYQNMREDGIKAYRESYRYDTLSGDLRTLPYSLTEMARIQTACNNVDSTLYYYKEAIDAAQRIGNIEQVNGIQSELASIYIQLEEYDNARKSLNTNNESGFLGWGELYYNTGQQDSARYYYLKALETDNIYVKRGANESLYKLAKSLGLDKETIDHLEQYVKYNDSIQQITDREGMERVKSLYVYQHIEQEKNQLLLEKQQHQIIALFSIFIATALAAGAYIVYYRSHKRKQEWEEQARRTRYFQQQQMKNKDSEIVKLKQQMEHILLKKQKENTECFQTSKICCFIRDNISKPGFKFKDENWEELQQQIDFFYDGFTERLRIRYPRISEKEMRVCLLIKAGLSNKEIANMVYMQHNSVSTLRERLFKKVFGEPGSAAQWDEFIVRF
ncbi:tetratricopeptide repeat protein [Bacteroides sp. 519]|uniref:tetratricopeptide repeat protein n=1 Tax=Bacteroides sp. 519 TaxID=2302937 RepID=UPI0013D5028A|nr:tetratricopeptide repeat protein [Bacteroides sp. 519]